MSDISKDKLADELERAEQARRIILSDIRNQYKGRIMEIERNSENRSTA